MSDGTDAVSDAERPVCGWCGAAAPTETLPLTWVTSVENGRWRVCCDRCAREHIRAIEGKLDSAWW